MSRPRLRAAHAHRLLDQVKGIVIHDGEYSRLSILRSFAFIRGQENLTV